MLRLISGVTVCTRIRPTPRLRSSPSPHLLSHPAFRSIYSTPGSITKAFKARRKMAEALPQTRPLSEVEVDPGETLASVGKKPRLDTEAERPEEQASTSTAKQTPANAVRQSKQRTSKKKKKKQLPPEPYSHEDVLWRDVRDLLGVGVADGIIKERKEWESPFQYGEELEVEVSTISSTGMFSTSSYPVNIDLSVVPLFIR